MVRLIPEHAPSIAEEVLLLETAVAARPGCMADAASLKVMEHAGPEIKALRT